MRRFVSLCHVLDRRGHLSILAVNVSGIGVDNVSCSVPHLVHQDVLTIVQINLSKGGICSHCQVVYRIHLKVIVSTVGCQLPDRSDLIALLQQAQLLARHTGLIQPLCSTQNGPLLRSKIVRHLQIILLII